jgi:hypothetical protein
VTLLSHIHLFFGLKLDSRSTIFFDTHMMSRKTLSAWSKCFAEVESDEKAQDGEEEEQEVNAAAEQVDAAAGGENEQPDEQSDILSKLYSGNYLENSELEVKRKALLRNPDGKWLEIFGFLPDHPLQQTIFANVFTVPEKPNNKGYFFDFPWRLQKYIEENDYTTATNNELAECVFENEPPATVGPMINAGSKKRSQLATSKDQKAKKSRISSSSSSSSLTSFDNKRSSETKTRAQAQKGRGTKAESLKNQVDYLLSEAENLKNQVNFLLSEVEALKKEMDK